MRFISHLSRPSFFLLSGLFNALFHFHFFVSCVHFHCIRVLTALSSSFLLYPRFSPVCFSSILPATSSLRSSITCVPVIVLKQFSLSEQHALLHDTISVVVSFIWLVAHLLCESRTTAVHYDPSLLISRQGSQQKSCILFPVSQFYESNRPVLICWPFALLPILSMHAVIDTWLSLFLYFTAISPLLCNQSRHGAGCMVLSCISFCLCVPRWWVEKESERGNVLMGSPIVLQMTYQSTGASEHLSVHQRSTSV